MKAIKSIVLSAALLLTTAGVLRAQDARYLIQTNQFQKAKSLLLKDLRNGSLSADYIYQLGKLYVQEKKADSAAKIFALLSTTDNDQRMLNVLGNAYAELNAGTGADNHAAINLTLQKNLKYLEASKSVLVKLEAAELLATVGELEKATELLEAACNQKPVHAENFVAAGDVYVRLSFLLNNTDLYGKACGRYEQALLIDKNYLPALTALGRAYIHSRNYPEARTRLQTALSVDSTWAPALQLMGELQYDLGRYDAASRYYTSYIQKVKPGKQALYKYAFILFFNKQYKESREVIAGLLKDDNGNRVLLRLMGYTSCELKDPATGLPAMEQLFTLSARTDTTRLLADDYEYYGRLLSLVNKDSLAIVQYRKALSIDTSAARVYEYIARSCEKTKHYREAYDAYNEVVARSTSVASSVWFSKGRMAMLIADQQAAMADTLQRTGMLQSAIEAFDRVISMSPASHLGYLWKGRAQASLDPESELALAEASYTTSVQMLEQKNQPDKYKTELTEAYSYLAYLNYLKFEAQKSTDAVAAGNFKIASLGYWDKILALDPANPTALQAKKSIK